MRVKVLSHNLHSCPMPFLLYKFRVGGGVVEFKTTAVLIATLLFSWDLCSARTDVLTPSRKKCSGGYNTVPCTGG